MNQLFLDKLHLSMNDKNRKLLESVERLYMVCEQKAQLESVTKGMAGRVKFGLLDAEDKEALATDPTKFIDYIRAKSDSAFRDDFASKTALADELIAKKEANVGGTKLVVSRVIANKPDEKLVILKEEGAENPNEAYCLYVAVA